ncbi:MAG: hypothetical protein HFI82_09995 [Eubacterium sp.]|nr:hypothetical protein [Eubacterium sp.]
MLKLRKMEAEQGSLDEPFVGIKEGLCLSVPAVNEITFCELEEGKDSIFACLRNAELVDESGYVNAKRVTRESVKDALPKMEHTKWSGEQIYEAVYRILMNEPAVGSDLFWGKEITKELSQKIFQELEQAGMIDVLGRLDTVSLSEVSVQELFGRLIAEGELNADKLNYIYDRLYHVPRAVAFVYKNKNEPETSVSLYEYMFDAVRLSNGAEAEVQKKLFFGGIKAMLDTKTQGKISREQALMVKNVLLNRQLATPACCYWKFAPFRMYREEGMEDRLKEESPQMRIYNNHPFDAHAIAGIHLGAYEKYTVISYVKTVMEWADSLFMEDTWESVSFATMLYVLAEELLGERPKKRPVKGEGEVTYGEIEKQYQDNPGGIPQFLICLEEKIDGTFLGAPEHWQEGFPQEGCLYFKVPENQEILSLWEVAEDRLKKIRNSMNIYGEKRTLLLNERSLNAKDILRLAAGSGSDGCEQSNTKLSDYRFLYLLERAKGMVSQIAQCGAGFLAALEKKDAGELSLFRENQEQAVQTAAAAAYAIPQTGSPFAMTYGGVQLGSVLSCGSAGAQIAAIKCQQAAGRASVMAAYERRREEWEFQKNSLAGEIVVMEKQKEVYEKEYEAAKSEYELQALLGGQKQAYYKMLCTMFTNKELYQWTADRLNGIYRQMYQCGMQLIRLTEKACQYECDTDEQFIPANMWRSDHKGLTAGDNMMLALLRMEQAYLECDRSHYELEKIVSVANAFPEEFERLRKTGFCRFSFTKTMFDEDYPSHYLRKIKSVSVSIPVILPPYEMIKATLSQTKNCVLLKPDKEARESLAQGILPDSDFVRVDFRSNQKIAVSRGIDDAGVFELRFMDHDYMPFEGTGAISDWEFSMPKETNRFDFDTLPDVLIKIKYTAKDAGELFLQSRKDC